jgi:hypothetical protein
MKGLALVSAFGLALACAGLSPAAATQVWDNTFSTCTSANCSAIALPGTINGDGSTAGPWTIEVFAGANECLRLAVVSQSVDTEIVAVQPNGVAFRDDDSLGSSRPLVKIRGTQQGWYTVQVSHFAGAAVESDFVFTFARYNALNPNCNSPTVGRGTERAAKSGSTGPRVTGGPSSQ